MDVNKLLGTGTNISMLAFLLKVLFNPNLILVSIFILIVSDVMQPGLIQSIIKDLGLDASSNQKKTPADGILHPDPNGAPREDSWNFCSIIGKLNFLAQNTRPDI